LRHDPRADLAPQISLSGAEPFQSMVGAGQLGRSPKIFLTKNCPAQEIVLVAY
jgi:hypothetical protein